MRFKEKNKKEIFEVFGGYLFLFFGIYNSFADVATQANTSKPNKLKS